MGKQLVNSVGGVGNLEHLSQNYLEKYFMPIAKLVLGSHVEFPKLSYDDHFKKADYNTFHLSAEWFEGSRFVSYYAEEVGNVVKEVIYLRSGWGVNHALTLELKDWSYTP